MVKMEFLTDVNSNVISYSVDFYFRSFIHYIELKRAFYDNISS